METLDPSGRKRLVVGIANEENLAWSVTNIRVNAVSAGPIKTRAASDMPHFDELLDEVAHSPATRTYGVLNSLRLVNVTISLVPFVSA